MGYSSWHTDKDHTQQSAKVVQMTTPVHFVVVLIILFAALGLVWFFWSPTPSPTAPGEIPVIEAPLGPNRIRPDDPGAPEVPYQDKVLYSEIAAHGFDNTKPKFVDSSETPLKLEAPDTDPDDIETRLILEDSSEENVPEVTLQPAELEITDTQTIDAEPEAEDEETYEEALIRSGMQLKMQETSADADDQLEIVLAPKDVKTKVSFKVAEAQPATQDFPPPSLHTLPRQKILNQSPRNTAVYAQTSRQVSGHSHDVIRLKHKPVVYF